MYTLRLNKSLFILNYYFIKISKLSTKFIFNYRKFQLAIFNI